MIKEMNLTAHDSQEIEGVNNVPVNQLQIISNGYVEKMTCYCLDNLVMEDRNRVFGEAVKKIKVGGVMNLRFAALDLIQKQIASDNLTSQKYSEALPAMQSIWSEKDFHNVVDQIGYVLDSQYYEGINIVATIKKK